jgi:Tfp pilus assembly protein PilV
VEIAEPEAWGWTPSRQRGIVLLEVVLALAIFVGVAMAVCGGLSVSVRSARFVREEAQATDLAVTILSEIQMGLVQAADAGPTPFEAPYADWTWQTVLTPGLPTGQEAADMPQVEVLVRNTPSGYAYHLYQLMPAGAAAPPASDVAAGLATRTGGAL